MKSIARHPSMLIPASLAMFVVFVGCGSDSPNKTPRPDAGRDSPSDIARDSPPLGPETGDVPIDVPRDLPFDHGDKDVPVYDGPGVDGPGIDSPRIDGTGIDGPGIDGTGVDQQIVDAGPCPAGQVLRYTSPGCGADVKPVCGSPNQDACARSACSCSGKVIIGCDYFSEPWSKLTDWTTGCGALDGGATIDTGVSEAGGQLD